jgi:ubiquinone/menaquinone biosynthesis C-methylase UbiE
VLLGWLDLRHRRSDRLGRVNEPPATLTRRYALGQAHQVRGFYDTYWSRISPRIDRAPAFLRRMGLDDGLCRGSKVLVVGYGSGLDAHTILNVFQAEEVVGIDIEPGNEARARENIAKWGGGCPTLKTADINDWEFRGERFDLGVALGVLHHTGSVSRSLSSLRRHLKPRGRLLVTLFRKTPLFFPHRVISGLSRRYPRLAGVPLYWLAVLVSRLYLTVDREEESTRILSVQEGVRDALLVGHMEANTDEGWVRTLEQCGFDRARVCGHYGLMSCMGSYLATKV